MCGLLCTLAETWSEHTDRSPPDRAGRPAAAPDAWLVIAYLGSLAVLLVSAFWSTNSFTGAVVRSFTTDNVVRVLTDPVFRTATVRTVAVALAVTLICAVLAVPLALYMAKIASPAVRLMLAVAVTTPLWASYLVKAYAWRMMFSPRVRCPGRPATRRATGLPPPS